MTPATPETRLEEMLPGYDFEEAHDIWVAAPPADVFAAVKEATPREMPLLRTLFAIRSLPALATRRRGLAPNRDRPLYAQLLGEYGFAVLADEADRELLLGLVDQPWKARGGTRRVHGADEFADFRETGYVKAAMNFLLQGERGGTRLQTTTRILATDPASRKKFGRYWRVIRPGSGLVRRSWLGAIKRRAESRARTASPG